MSTSSNRIAIQTAITARVRSAATMRTRFGSPTAVQALPLLLQAAVVRRGAAVEDGNLIELIEPAWRAITAALSSDPTLAYRLSAEQWEQLVAASYEKAGYDEVILTPRSGDLGRDVIAVRKGWGTVRIIDQVKAFKPGHLVTANDVRAAYGVASADPQTTKAIVTTTSDFAPRLATDRLLAPLIPYRLELVNGKELLERLASLSAPKSSSGA